LVQRDASLVDRIWGLGFVVAAWSVWLIAAERGGTRDGLLLALVTIWGLRLSAHITWRNWGHGEDPRYAAWRAQNGARWWWRSLVTVFLLQGVLILVIALPLMVAIPTVGAAWGRVFGTTLWLIGFAFEAGGDWQLARFRANPANRGTVLDTGFWRYSRHPNYFGDALQWWGFWCFAVGAGGWWTIISPIVMTGLLLKVSGVTLLESTLVETKPAYRDYIRRTSAFVPWPPRP
jgi:steroid 5-alpha reductase family enzyme